MRKTLQKLLGDPNKKLIATYQPIVDSINDLESSFEKLSEDELKAKTAEFKDRLQNGENLDDILPEAFATVREVGKRLLDMRHYDVQLVGGLALHQGRIAEMRTGEGKTLVATLPAYLNALEGNGVHVITVNDYLAKRDAVWMAKIYDYLGLSVSIIQNQRVSFVYDGEGASDESSDEASFHIEDQYLKNASRQEAYQCDITYGTNNEFGFDYLRDNMVQDVSEMVMRPGSEMSYAIIDEIDSILIDEARTPLIISAPAEEAAEQYYQFAKWVTRLEENVDYNVDEKMRSATLSDDGITKFEELLGVENLYVEGGVRMIHHIEQALKAEVLFKKDKDYIVEEGEVVIIDEFTGRKMPGRRYSEGLHQAIEAKEGVDIKRESRTLATITFQNLFRMYDKLSGMTGTAETEIEEFLKIYGLDVLVIPTNRPDARIDQPDRIYRTEEAKYKAIVSKIKECKEKGQPILIGTISVEKNEELSVYLEKQGISFEALNAKNHEREGEIIAQAGRPGAVTLATNMAGRGVDIRLGGNPVDPDEEKKVKDAGGLFVLGTERHESRRIDNQLRGRSARQGDPGETQFFVATDDDLMRIFAGDRLKTVMTRLNVPDDMPIEQRMITRMLENAQKKVESHNFDTRKHLLEYDDVLNRQREVIYTKRRHILELAKDETVIQEDEKEFDSYKDVIMDMIEQEIEFVVSFHTNTEDASSWDVKEVYETMKTVFTLSNTDREELLKIGSRDVSNDKVDDVQVRDNVVTFLLEKAKEEYEKMEQSMISQAPDEEAGKKTMRAVEKGILLRVIDNLWVDYLVALRHLRQGIGLRGYAQRDPLLEYKKESFHLFNQLLADIQKEVVHTFFKVGIGLQLAPTIMASDKMTLQGAKKSNIVSNTKLPSKPRDERGKKIGRNDPCHCGSGKKMKKCHPSG